MIAKLKQVYIEMAETNRIIVSSFFLPLFLLLLLPSLTFADDNWWNESWKYRVLLNLSETQGINRIFEPTDVNLQLDFTKIQNCTEELRIIKNEKEIPSQVYNETRLGNKISCNIVFLANVSSNSTDIYYVYYGNPHASAPSYLGLHYTFSEGPSGTGDFTLIKKNKEVLQHVGNITFNFDNVEIWGGYYFGRANYNQGFFGFSPSDLALAGHLGTGNWGEADIKKRNSLGLHTIWYNATVDCDCTKGFGRNNNRIIEIIRNGPIFIDIKISGDEYAGWQNTSLRVFNPGNVNGLRIIKFNSILSINTTIEGHFTKSTNYWGRTHTGIKFLISDDLSGCYRNEINPSHYCVWVPDQTYQNVINVENTYITYVNKTSTAGFIGIFEDNWNSTPAYHQISVSGYGYDPDDAGQFMFVHWNTDPTTGDTPNNGLNPGIYRFGGYLFALKDRDSQTDIDNLFVTILNPVRVLLGSEEEIPIIIYLNPTNIDGKFYVNSTPTFNIEVFYKNDTLSNLTQSNFKIFIDGQPQDIATFENLHNGSYRIGTDYSSSILGRHSTKVEVGFANVSGSNTTFFYWLVEPADRIMFISDENWKNILSLTPLKKPVLVSKQIDEPIETYTRRYQPEQVFLIGEINGSLLGAWQIADHTDIPPIFFGTDRGVWVGISPDLIKNLTLAALLAARLDKPLVFDSDLAELDLSGYSLDELEELYLTEVQKTRQNLNYLVIAAEYFPEPLHKVGSLAALLAAQRMGLVIWPETSNSARVKERIAEVTARLAARGLFTAHPDYYLNGAHLLLVGGVPFVAYPDPVEQSLGLNDPLDGEVFPSDLEYGDLDGDGYLDVGVGRLPPNLKLASLLFVRARLTDAKQALIISEYLHTAWPIILLYAGGGMWHGRTLTHTLREQAYNITRLVEHRAYVPDFLTNLKPSQVKDYIAEVKEIAARLGLFLGERWTELISKFLLILRGLWYVEKGLELYLEYDWSTIDLTWENLISTAHVYLDKLSQDEPLTPEDAVYLVMLLWPRPWPELTQTNLAIYLPQADIIYYGGLGNQTAWILPNEVPADKGFLGWEEFFTDRYNGSETFLPDNITSVRARLVWDNSNLAGVGEMGETFLQRGAASFVGASAINYHAFSAEIDSRFFSQGDTAGGALADAVNQFRDDWITWDPLNLLRPGIKAKALREFVLWGDPSMPKDPLMTGNNQTEVGMVCDDVCELSVNMTIPHELVSAHGQTTIHVDTPHLLLVAGEPIIPLKRFDYWLPYRTRIINWTLRSETRPYANISLPILNLTTYNFTLNLTSNHTVWPPKPWRLNVSHLGNRTRIQLVHTTIVYNKTSREARVTDKIYLRVKYASPIDFFVTTTNIREGEVEPIRLIMWANTSLNVTVYLKVSNQTHWEVMSQNLMLLPGWSETTLSYRPGRHGDYLVRAFLFGPDLVVGPRTSHFNVQDITPPTLRLLGYGNASRYKPGDSLTLTVSVADNDVVVGDCAVWIGTKLAGHIPHHMGWCNGSILVPEGVNGPQVINVTATDQTGNLGYNDLWILILYHPGETLPRLLTYTLIPKQADEPEAKEAFCGDGVCELDETCETCPTDCGPCPPASWCGDSVCDPDESSETCPEGCPPMPTVSPSPPTEPLGLPVGWVVWTGLPIGVGTALAVGLVLWWWRKYLLGPRKG